MRRLVPTFLILVACSSQASLTEEEAHVAECSDALERCIEDMCWNEWAAWREIRDTESLTGFELCYDRCLDEPGVWTFQRSVSYVDDLDCIENFDPAACPATETAYWTANTCWEVGFYDGGGPEDHSSCLEQRRLCLGD